MSYWILTLYTFGLMSSIVMETNCPYKECYCAGTAIMCDFLNLYELPQNLFNNSPSMSALYLGGNPISRITAGRLPANLSLISFDENPIETIDDAAFDKSIYTLQDLIFSGARFTQIPQAVFHLKALRSLQIDQTTILTWYEDGMNQLGSTLKSLSLTSVGLTSWPTWMKSMTNLTDLTISVGSISIIPDDGLAIMACSLTNLEISYVGLTTLPKSLSEMTVLGKLTLNDNKLTDVAWLPQLSPLDTLFINNNKITGAQKLSNALRPFANTLNNFYIQNNSLISIPDLSFLTQLSYLIFELNHISDSNSGSFPSNLTQLDFEHNLLSSIPSHIINLKLLTSLSLTSNNIQIVQGSYIPTSVRVLDLTFNSVSQLTRSSFPYNSRLDYLILNNNPLSSISPDAFYNLVVLTHLILQNTKLTRLPLAISSLTNLNQLDVSNSKSLVCTCQEQSLGTWFKTFSSNGIVIGECGLTTVYYFFQVLNLQCPQIS